MKKQNETLLDTARRRSEVLRLRKQGLQYRTIAERLLAEHGEEHLPNGWDARYAAKDVKRELRKLQTANEETAEDIRQMELARLDRMLRGLWAKATSGDTDAVKAILSVMKRRAKLLGLDAPERMEVDGKINILELRAVIIRALSGYPEARLAVAGALDEHARKTELDGPGE